MTRIAPTALYQEVAERLRQRIFAHDLTPGDWIDEQKLADYYASGMDQASIEAAGAKPLQGLFDGIAAIDSLGSLQSQVARLHSQGVSAFFSFGSSQDLKDSKKIIGETAQGGLGLPERDYYFKTDEKSVEIRNAYQKHVERTFQLLGDSPESAAAAAQKVMDVETKLAGISLTMEELRDPNKLYNPHSRAQLEQLTPNLNWNQYLADRGMDNLDGLNVATPEYFKGLTKLLGETPLEDLKGYLRWHAIAANSWALSKPFEDENFEFNKVMTGVKTKNDRWKKVVTATEGIADLWQGVRGQFFGQGHRRLARTRQLPCAPLRKQIRYAQLEIVSRQLLDIRDAECAFLHRQQIAQRFPCELDGDRSAGEVSARRERIQRAFEVADMRSHAPRDHEGDIFR